MYQEFYGLNEKPFGLTPDPKFLFFSEKHREALDHLLYGMQQKEGFVLISGDSGTGKTTLCRALLERSDPEDVTSSLVLNPLLNEEELLRAIVQDFGLPARGTSRKELLDELNEFLLHTVSGGKTAVLIIDEAQNLSNSCLELVRLLSNLETDKQKLIQIFLVGSEQLPARLQQSELRHLQQRISLRYHLRSLSPQETHAYVHHRLNMAGAAGGTVFTRRACAEIYTFSEGVPRLINMIADRSLLAGYFGRSRTIGKHHVLEGQESLNRELPAREKKYVHWFVQRWRRFALGAVALMAAAGLLLSPSGSEMMTWIEKEHLTRADFAPGSSSRHLIRAAIPLLGEGARKGLATAGDQEVANAATDEHGKVLTKLGKSRTVNPGTNGKSYADKGQSQTVATGSSQAGGAESRKTGGDGMQTGLERVAREKTEVHRPAAESKATRRASLNKIPQYVFKPPYTYTVQVESYKTQRVATKRMRQLRKRGLDAWVAWVDLGKMGIWHRVLVGRYDSKREAKLLARRLKQSFGFPWSRQIAANRDILVNFEGASL